METGPLLKVTDLSFSKLIYSVFKKHETVCERKKQQQQHNSVVLEEVNLKSLGMNINIPCFL